MTSSLKAFFRNTPQLRSRALRACRALALAAAAVLAISVCPAGEKAPARLPAPLLAYASSTHPARLAVVLDQLLLAILKGTEREDTYPAGTLPKLLAIPGMPAFLADPDVRASLLIVADESGGPRYGYSLSSVDGPGLLADLRRTGFDVVEQEGQAVIEGGPLPSGVQLFMREMNDSRLLFAHTEEDCLAFIETLGAWNPGHPEGVDLRVIGDAKRARELYPELAETYLDEALALVGEGSPVDDLVRILPPSLRPGATAAAEGLVRRFAPLPLEIDVACLDLTTENGLLLVAAALAVDNKGTLADLSRRYADADNPAYTLIETVGDDALFMSAFAPIAGHFFADGDVFSVFAAALVDALAPQHADEAAALRRRLNDNAVREEVAGVYMRDGSPVLVKFLTAANSRDHIADTVVAAELANRCIPGPGLRLTAEADKVGGIAYRRIAPTIAPPDDPADHRRELADVINSCSLYLASNRNTVLSVAGCGLAPTALEADAARLSPGIDNALATQRVYADVVERMTTRQLGHVLVRASALFNQLIGFSLRAKTFRPASASFDPDVFIRSLQDGGDLAGCGFGAVPGGLTVQLALPLSTINDLVLNAYRLRAVTANGDAPPDNRPDAGGWDDDDTAGEARQ